MTKEKIIKAPEHPKVKIDSDEMKLIKILQKRIVDLELKMIKLLECYETDSDLDEEDSECSDSDSD